MPFFRSAVSGTPARHYAVDTVRNEPGYFFRLADSRRAAGLAGDRRRRRQVRASARLERRWLAQEAPALIVDSNGIVLLASPPEWRYATLQPLAPESAG
jgi:C4-dicarboxylate-specific signal transduction histidine kinase